MSAPLPHPSPQSLAKEAQSTCSYCGVGCHLRVTREKHRISLTGDPDSPVNRGQLCSKGRTLQYTVMDKSDRLLFPELRTSKAAPHFRLSWEDALERAASVFASVVRRYGPEAVAFYVSGQLLTEEYYLANKIAKGIIGTANIDTNSRLCMSSAVAGYKQSLGADTVPISYADIEQADVFLIAGANPAYCHPILFRRIEAQKEARPESKIILVDPRHTESAELADLHLQITPGSDVALFLAIAKVLIEEEWIDKEFIKNHVSGFPELKARTEKSSLSEAAFQCGCTVAEIEEAAQIIGKAKGFLTLWAVGLNQSAIGVNKNTALINLNLITGHIGRPGSGPFSLTGQPNAMGGREVGGLSNMLAAHRSLENPEHRLEVARHWSVPESRIPKRPGLSAVEMFDAMRAGKIKALWIICTNPAASMPDSNRIEEALQKTPFVVVQDISKNSETLAYADLRLPAAGWLEKEGTMTNSERRISYLPKLTEAPGEARADAEILQDFMIRLSEKLHGESLIKKTISEIYEEHALLTAGTNIDISGLSHERLRREGSFQWPVPHDRHPGTERLFADGRFYTRDGRARLFFGDEKNTSEATSKEFPFVLTTGRYRDVWHTRTRTDKVQRLRLHSPRPLLEIHPQDADRLQIREGSLLDVRGKRGSVRLRAHLTRDIRKGVLFAPMHWGKRKGDARLRINNLTNPLFDPVSKEPDFKYTAVQIRPIPPSDQKILIVGAGAAARSFLGHFRAENQEAKITVLGAEKEAFYNRIFLPELISQKKPWAQLTCDIPEGSGIKNTILREHKAIYIDKKNKIVKDAKGQTHPYDTLILATGSRPRVLSSPVSHLSKKNLHTLRDRGDAERLQKKSGRRILVLGGGLLGIELAWALMQLGREVHIVHRSPHLMSRQLDKEASNILKHHLQKHGIHLHLNEELLTAQKAGQSGSMAYLSSGERLLFDDLVFALGTEPRTELAKAAGLSVSHGIRVTEKLETSDPNIFAIGECAEFQGRTWGTTLAAEEMGKALAPILSGEAGVSYEPSIDLNVLKIDGLPLAAFGKRRPQSKKDEVLLLSDLGEGIYKKIILSKRRVAGAILVGDTSDLSHLQELHAKGLELEEERRGLLGGSAARMEVKGEILCSCLRVGEGNAREAIAEGATDLDSLMQDTKAGTACGSCRPSLLRLLKESQKNAGGVP